MRRKRKVGAPKGRKRGGASLPCPICGSHSFVVNTKRIEKIVERRRRCIGPKGHGFWSREEVVV